MMKEGVRKDIPQGYSVGHGKPSSTLINPREEDFKEAAENIWI